MDTKTPTAPSPPHTPKHVLCEANHRERQDGLLRVLVYSSHHRSVTFRTKRRRAFFGSLKLVLMNFPRTAHARVRQQVLSSLYSITRTGNSRRGPYTLSTTTTNIADRKGSEGNQSGMSWMDAAVLCLCCSVYQPVSESRAAWLLDFM